MPDKIARLITAIDALRDFALPLARTILVEPERAHLATLITEFALSIESPECDSLLRSWNSMMNEIKGPNEPPSLSPELPADFLWHEVESEGFGAMRSGCRGGLYFGANRDGTSDETEWLFHNRLQIPDGWTEAIARLRSIAALEAEKNTTSPERGSGLDTVIVRRIDGIDPHYLDGSSAHDEVYLELVSWLIREAKLNDGYVLKTAAKNALEQRGVRWEPSDVVPFLHRFHIAEEVLNPPLWLEQRGTCFNVSENAGDVLRELETQMKGTSLPTSPEAKGKNGTGRTINADFFFVPSGTGYHIRAFNVEGHVGKLAGFKDLHKLLRTPGIPVPWSEIDGGDFGVDRRTVQPTYDATSFKRISDERKRLQAEIDTSDNEVDRKDSQAKLDELNAKVAKDTKLGGQGRNLNSIVEKIRPKIHNRLRTAYEKLKSAQPSMAKLGEHLEASVTSTPAGMLYDPSPVITWKCESED